MSWSRGKDKVNPGKFAYTLSCGFTELETVGGFDTAQDADRAAELAERKLMTCGYDPVEYSRCWVRDNVDGAIWEMLSDDELIRELLG